MKLARKLKIAVIGAAGVRTPLIVDAMVRRHERLGLTELALMDIDADRLAVIGQLLPLAPFDIMPTTDARVALRGADFVITTFRVGGIAARALDETIPLEMGLLGQETTGPGGFAMAMRSIPVLLDYIGLMREECPQAWLINFANPAGLLAEAATTVGGWPRAVGICDAPEGMLRVAAAVLGVPPSDVHLDYFGLNHLGWVRGVRAGGKDYLPQLIDMIVGARGMPGLPFAPELIRSLGMIPNEYLFYYYHGRDAVENLRAAGTTRALELVKLNEELFAKLAGLSARGDVEGMRGAHTAYLRRRGESYMARETGGQDHGAHAYPALAAAMEGEGYAGVALDLVEALNGGSARHMTLNLQNGGATSALPLDAVLEIPAHVSRGVVQPLALAPLPGAELGLMLQVKAYERLTVRAVVEGSKAAAVQALAIHPLVRDYRLACRLVEAYAEAHGELFPALA
jgi:6-phospho-beta-glucosidase